MRNILNLSTQFDFLYISCFQPDVDFDVTQFDNLFDCVRIELVGKIKRKKVKTKNDKHMLEYTYSDFIFGTSKNNKD